MNDPIAQPISVSAERLTPLFDQASAAAINVGELLDSLNLDPELAEASRSKTLSLADYYRIQNRLAILFGDETLHLSSRQLLQGSTDYVLQHVDDARSLFDAMRIIARSYNLLHGGEYNSVTKRRGSVEYVIDDRAFTYAPGLEREYQYFSIECTLIFLHCMLIIVSPKAEDAIKALQIRRPLPGGDCAHLGYWNAPIKFGAEIYKISFDREIALSELSLPIADALTSNAVYQKIVDVVAGKHALYEKAYSVAARVRDALSRGVVEQSDVAAQMGVSTATLRRRLNQERASFRDLRREVLNETAKRLLLEKRSVADVSETLGFSEYRAFNRAFRDWNGVTPKTFVRQFDRA
jgi:AraC-like DNA-binding protein